MPAMRFFNPRRRENALWASAVETWLRYRFPELSLRERRNLPMMQGVYLHLRANENGRVLPFPETPAELAGLDPAQRQALLSQAFFGLATLHLTAVAGGADFYNQQFIPAVLSFDDQHGIRQFSTDDLAGFFSCLVLWQFYYGNGRLSAGEIDLLERLEAAAERFLDLTPQEIAAFRDFIAAARAELPAVGAFPYRDAPPGYGSLQIPSNARVVMLGDWGTSLQDAEALLEAVWIQVYEAGPALPIVFVHLGDIYYSGLPVECQQNFYQVFSRARQALVQRFGSAFQQAAAQSKIYVIPGNHEYYSEGYGFYQLVDDLEAQLATGQKCSFFCLRTANNLWQLLGMDTGQDDHNAFEPISEKIRDTLLPLVQAAVDLYVPFPFSIWTKQWIASIVQEYTGPFAPQLRSAELAWHRARLDETAAQTILLSHHQLFSSVQEVDHRTPQFLNTHLRKDFSSYFPSKVAAWFWGHEHSYALYEDGLLGLNKGRLLGSSSFESSESTDHPYKVAYPRLPFSAQMQQPHQENGFYDHACAVFDFSKASVVGGVPVTYYGFPSWGQSDPPPSAPQLYVLATEAISPIKANALTPGWSGNVTIAADVKDSKGNYVSNPYQSTHAPALAVTQDQKTLVMVWQDSASSHLQWATCPVTDPPSGNLAWKLQGPVQAKNAAGATSTLATDSAPTLVQCGQLFLLVYKTQGGQKLRYATLPTGTWAWLDWGFVSYGSSQYVSTNSGPGLTGSYEGAYLAFADANQSNYLKWMVYSPPAAEQPTAAGKWNAPAAILSGSGGNPLPATGPLSMSANGKTAFLAFRLDGKDAIRLASRDMVIVADSQPPKVKLNPDQNWTVGKALQVGATPLDTTAGMAIAADEDYLYLVYTSETSNNTPDLRQAFCPVPGTLLWQGNVKLLIQGSTLNPQSQSAPGLFIGKETALLVYPGAAQPHLLEAWI